MERQGAAQNPIPEQILREAFIASKAYVGDHCYLCPEPIKYEDSIRYYGGPFIIHSACLLACFDGI